MESTSQSVGNVESVLGLSFVTRRQIGTRSRPNWFDVPAEPYRTGCRTSACKRRLTKWRAGG
jgi:hypothetical protein